MSVLHLLRVLFLIAFCSASMFYGVNFMWGAFSNDDIGTLTEPSNFELEMYSSMGKSTDYIVFKTSFDTLNLVQMYSKTDRRYRFLCTMLKRTNFWWFPATDPVETYLPLKLNSDQCREVQIRYHLNERHEVDWLAMNGIDIIGSDFGFAGKVLKFIGGFVLMALGLLFAIGGAVKFYESTQEAIE